MSKSAIHFPEYEVFGKYMREAREEMKFSRAEVGSALELAESSIRQVEYGHHGVYLKDAIVIANLLGFSLSSVQSDCAALPATKLSKRRVIEARELEMKKLIDMVQEMTIEHEETKKALNE